MSELTPIFIRTAEEMGVPLPPRHRAQWSWIRIAWPKVLTRCHPRCVACQLHIPFDGQYRYQHRLSRR